MMKIKILPNKRELTQLRREIAQLDRAFLDVFAHYLARRQSLAADVGRIKKTASMPVRDPAVEREVEKRFVTRLGRILGAPATLRLARAILAASRSRQKSR